MDYLKVAKEENKRRKKEEQDKVKRDAEEAARIGCMKKTLEDDVKEAFGAFAGVNGISYVIQPAYQSKLYKGGTQIADVRIQWEDYENCNYEYPRKETHLVARWRIFKHGELLFTGDDLEEFARAMSTHI
jgi:hypothetical protein